MARLEPHWGGKADAAGGVRTRPLEVQSDQPPNKQMPDCIETLLELIHKPLEDDWAEQHGQALKALFGAQSGRYRQAAAETVTLRAPGMKNDAGIPFAAYIHPSNPPQGPYGGMSFVLFPVPDAPCLVSFVVGTQGLSPDEAILGRPGHARKVQAICAWLNRQYGQGKLIAWAKQEPTRTDLDVPDAIKLDWAEYQRVFARYGKVLYCAFRPTTDRAATTTALKALLDLLFEERGQKPLTDYLDESNSIQRSYFAHLMPATDPTQVVELLSRRKYVILQGPPGTGKTRMAGQILRQQYDSFGRAIQFHPNVTYENFVGGLAPTSTEGSIGFRFAPAPGFLWEAAAEAERNPSRNYLLLIDEINRADLGKILGEAIYLLEPEPEAGAARSIDLPHDFGPPFHRTLRLPPNLHILGTMNTADRSIAIVDVAVRRRFAFVPLWPSMEVVKQHSTELSQRAFRDLLSIFVEHASDDAMSLVPGHSYFLASDEQAARSCFKTSLAPLLQEYLSQGYVAGFAESIRSYLQWLDSA